MYLKKTPLAGRELSQATNPIKKHYTEIQSQESSQHNRNTSYVVELFCDRTDYTVPLYVEKEPKVDEREDTHVQQVHARDAHVKFLVRRVVDEAEQRHEPQVYQALPQGELRANAEHVPERLGHVAERSREEAHDGDRNRQNETGDPVVEQEGVLRRRVAREKKTPQVRVAWLFNVLAWTTGRWVWGGGRYRPYERFMYKIC